MFGETFLASLIPSILVTVCAYISLNYLELADMTGDGCFSLGACSSVMFFTAGISSLFTIPLIFIMGSMFGIITAFMIDKVNINGLLAGIISMTGLQSVCYLILQNQSSINFENATMCYSSILYSAIFISLIIGMIYIVLRSEYGVALQMFSKNEHMLKSINISKNSVRYISIALLNGLIAVAGAVFIQSSSVVSNTIGGGIVIGGLIATIIGESLFSTKTPIRIILACMTGTIVYKSIIEFVTHEQALNLDAGYNNLLIAIMLIALFAIKDFRIVYKKKDDIDKGNNS